MSPAAGTGKKSAKTKEELVQEKKKELEKRLQDVSGQLNNNKKPPKKGTRVAVCGEDRQGFCFITTFLSLYNASVTVFFFLIT